MEVVASIIVTADPDAGCGEPVHSFSSSTNCQCDRCSHRDAVHMMLAIMQLCDERGIAIEDVISDALEVELPHAVH